MSQFYVYGLVGVDASVVVDGAAVANPEGAIFLERLGSVAALVSHVDEVEILPVRRNMMAHTKAIEAAMAQTTVLPMQFGVVADDLETLTTIVDRARDAVAMTLERLTGHTEVGVRLTWDQEAIVREVAAAEPGLQKTGTALVQQSEAESYYARIELGRKIDAALKRRRASDADRLTARLSPFASAMKSLDIKDDMTVLNVAMLVPNEELAALEAELEAIGSEEGERSTLKVVIPAPPYNFVSIRLDFSAPGPAHGEKAA